MAKSANDRMRALVAGDVTGGDVRSAGSGGFSGSGSGRDLAACGDKNRGRIVRETIPQGLKPSSFDGAFGTAEAVPFQSPKKAAPSEASVLTIAAMHSLGWLY